MGDIPTHGRGIATRWSLMSPTSLLVLWSHEFCVEVVVHRWERSREWLQVCTEWGVCLVSESFTKICEHQLYKEFPSRLTVIFYMSSGVLQNFFMDVYWLDTKCCVCKYLQVSYFKIILCQQKAFSGPELFT